MSNEPEKPQLNIAVVITSVLINWEMHNKLNYFIKQ
jgi:hypothetical protein